MLNRQWIQLTVAIVLALSLIACSATSASPTLAPTDTPPPLSGVRISTLPPPATGTPVPATRTPVPPAASATPGCVLSAGFVSDVTVPDGSSIAPNGQFVKTWRIRNSGTCDWGAGAALVFVEGDRLGGPASVAVPPTASGGTRDLSLTLKAPTSPGAYKGRWQLRTASGAPLTSLTVSIVVAFTPTPTGPPTATPKPTPVPTFAGAIESFTGLWILDETLGDPQRLQQLKIDQSDSKLLASPATNFGSPYGFGFAGFASTTYQGGNTAQWDFDDPALGHVSIKMTINKACNAKVRLSYPSYPQGGFVLYNVQSQVSCQ